METVFCYECSARRNGYVRHAWSPCDLTVHGEAIDPQPCGHRRPFRQADGVCGECRRLDELAGQIAHRRQSCETS